MWEEIYTDIIEGNYSVSDGGLIRNNRTGLILKGEITHSRKKKGKESTKFIYARVVLSNAGVTQRLSVSRIVATYFVDNPHDKEFVNHIDGDRLNNSASNLEWCTMQENQEHAVTTGLCPKGIDNAAAKCTEAQVIEVKQLLKQGLLKHKDIADTVGVTHYTVSDISCGRTWKHIII